MRKTGSKTMQVTRNKEKEDAIKKEVQKLSVELAAALKEKGASKKLQETFKKCFVNTAETTMQCLEDGSIFLITGDIEAMWLRDSSAQVCHYLPYIKKRPLLAEMVKGLIQKQFAMIAIDPYANAFNIEPNGRCWAKDHTADNPWDWERKYELDSLCYPIRLLYQYIQITGDWDIIDEDILSTLRSILQVMTIEQHHEERSSYFFERDNCPPSDTLPNEGKGTPVAYTGMIWSGFRPSDDACQYGYLIPANLFAATVLNYVEEIASQIGDNQMLQKAVEMRWQIVEGIDKYGKITLENGEIAYVYEVDGLGNINRMDDANVPSLLSIPWITNIGKTASLYLATRGDVLSSHNPYYYEGKAASGIGSPHTPKDYIWHIALSMQGLTSADKDEQKALVEKLLSTDAGTGYMHEGFHKDKPEEFTREWFAWSNSLFSLLVIEAYDLKEN